ncbi:MAG: hypothetical protein IAG10_31930 [Planctomycetaceae bacterium]|nr:hypothetical protein [Planctomycetaceae bacterium]
MRNLPRSTRSRVASRRSGSLMPALALALLAVLGGAALVIDRLALDTAKSELRIAAESAALAAARELANDDRLRPDFDPAALQMKSRFAAARIAAQNIVAGEPVMLSTDVASDVRFGRLINDPVTGEPIFVEADDEEPNSVAVVARCTEARQSAVSLPFRTFYAPSDADVVAVAEASLNFQVTGLRSVDGSPIPTLPLAILAQPSAKKDSPRKTSADSRNRPGEARVSNDSQQPTASSWMRDIEQRRGTDLFGYDVSTGEVTNEADGIPEITLRTAAHSSNSKTNAFVVHLTGELSEDRLRRQISQGWSADDLESLGGELLFDRGPLTMTGLRGVDGNVLAQSLRKVLGQSRVVFLYDQTEDDPRSHVVSLQVTKMVAGRVMSVREISEDECEIVLQPAVLATRSAVTADDGSDSGCEKNKYVANLRLTN